MDGSRAEQRQELEVCLLKMNLMDVEEEGLDWGETGRLQFSWDRCWASGPGRKRGEGRAGRSFLFPLQNTSTPCTEYSICSPGLHLPPHPRYRKWSHRPPGHSMKNPAVVVGSSLSPVTPTVPSTPPPLPLDITVAPIFKIHPGCHFSALLCHRGRSSLVPVPTLTVPPPPLYSPQSSQRDPLKEQCFFCDMN